MKKLIKMRKNEKGFTLIELIIVIAILAIIAAVAVPNIIGAVDNSRKASDVANAKIILNAAAQVTAKTTLDPVEATTAPGVYTFTTSGVAHTSGGGTTAGPAFATALSNELNGATLAPKYQGAGTASSFVLTITDSGTGISMVVTVNGTELAPNADSTYNQN